MSHGGGGNPPLLIIYVFFTLCQCVVSSAPDYQIFMGRDKFENEDLIAHAFPEDVWFHVSELSSAHVYVRMPFGCTGRYFNDSRLLL